VTERAADPGSPGAVPVVAAVVRRGARVLVALRPAEKRHGGMWEYPGGKVGAGESHAEALARELREELGVELVSVGSLRASYRDPGSPFEIHFWDAEVAGIPEAREHAELRWVTRAEGLVLPLAPSDRRFTEEVLGG
jgi:8-oxo-dGTP diphosphatase